MMGIDADEFLDGPDTQYKMLWGGAWRPVTNMWDATGRETSSPVAAQAVVLFVSEREWVSTKVVSGDLVRREDRLPSRREWTMID